ncbi:MAG: hypothetical protein BWY15_00862 [Firmicutes bacterium ADurb.Bin193]|nr:MAG: hypothetical protein BWY15_00862 [Firmicutes bacterium ADurb.Bin193]
MLERDLYEPVKNLLTEMGYDVKGEVKGCDITAMRGDELVVVELKKSFNLELVFQATLRQSVADFVYVAIPRPAKGYRTRRWRDIVRLADRLSLGIIVVADIQQEPVAEIILFPKESAMRRSKKKRLATINEHNSRTGSFNTGGVTGTKLITAYREQVLHIAAMLELHGSLGTRELRKLGTGPKTSAILRSNFYGWFAKEEKRHTLSEKGRKALLEYSELCDYYKKLKLDGDIKAPQ